MIGPFKIAYKLFPACFTKIILRPVAFFPVPYYGRAVTVRAIEFYTDKHSFIVSLFASLLS